MTAFFAFVACFFFHFRENNDKVPESSKNGPKKVPILPVRPEFCQCKDFLSQVPNPIFFFGAPVDNSITDICSTEDIIDWFECICLYRLTCSKQ